MDGMTEKVKIRLEELLQMLKRKNRKDNTDWETSHEV
jgi:hypothetical protein